MNVEELYAKYFFHPEIMDVFVEGEFDRDFLDLFFIEASIFGGVSIFPIELVAIPNEDIDRFKLRHGSNKYRVIMLAKLLDEKFGVRNTNVVCLVDTDSDQVLQNIKQAHHLKYTDYTCMEMYLLNLPVITKFLEFTCKLPKAEKDEFLKVASLILPSQFALRIVSESLNVSVSVPDFSVGLSVKKNLLSFDSKKYVKNFLALTQLTAEKKKEFISEFDTTLVASETYDLRNKSHGHDFVSLLFEYSWLKGGVRLQNKDDEVVKFGGRLLSATLNTQSLLTENLFKCLDAGASGKSFVCT